MINQRFITIVSADFCEKIETSQNKLKKIDLKMKKTIEEEVYKGTSKASVEKLIDKVHKTNFEKAYNELMQLQEEVRKKYSLSVEETYHIDTVTGVLTHVTDGVYSSVNKLLN